MHPNFCTRLGMTCPIIKAPMAGCDTPQLVAAVSQAGGLGMLGAAYLEPAAISASAQAIRRLTKRPFGINLFVEQPLPTLTHVQPALAAIAPLYAALGLQPPTLESLTAQPPTPDTQAQLASALQCQPRVLSFTFGLPPAAIISAAHQQGTQVWGNASNYDEVQQLADSGVDAIVLQGHEAGGHRSCFSPATAPPAIALNDLLSGARALTDKPLISAGGLMSGTDIAQQLQHGAQAGQLGTAFLTCDEAGITDSYRQALLAARPEQTRLTRAFSGRYARGLANIAMGTLEKHAAILPFPWQNALTRPLRSAAAQQQQAQYLSLWAGVGVNQCQPLPAAKLMQQLSATLL